MSCLTCQLPIPACCVLGLRVGVTSADVARLGAVAAAQLLPAPDLPGGYVGEIPRTAAGACTFLQGHACSIHETRPQACRDQDPFFCRGAVRRAGAA
jgi:Fe-S-cluster containining protein